MKNWFKVLLLFITGIIFISGMGRDDMPLSKYIQFAKQPVFDCIGEIYYKKEFQGSCVLIDKKFILTAAHLLSYDSGAIHTDSFYEPEGKRWLYMDIGEKWTIGNAKDFYVKLAGKKYKVKNIKVHERYLNTLLPSYKDSVELKLIGSSKFDIAVLELETEVKIIKPAQLYETDDELGKRAIMSGYGYMGQAHQYNDENAFMKHGKMGGENFIDSVGGFEIGRIRGSLLFDFDAPNSNCCNRMGDSSPLPLEYGPDGGDCGSGLFLSKYGEWKLAGMCNSTDHPSEYVLYGDKYGKYYGFTFDYIRIFAFKDWIRGNIPN